MTTTIERPETAPVTEAPRLAARIRAAYPEPRAADGTPGDGARYCVLGTLSLWQGDAVPYRFPMSVKGAGMLMDLNPALSPSVAVEYARSILVANDTGEIDTAWRLLDEALEWRPEAR